MADETESGAGSAPAAEPASATPATPSPSGEQGRQSGSGSGGKGATSGTSSGTPAVGASDPGAGATSGGDRDNRGRFTGSRDIKAKPIRPELPGVLRRGDDAFVGSRRGLDGAPAEDAAKPKDTKAPEPATAQPKVAPPEGDQPAPPADAPFKIGDLVFKSEAHAVQQLKTLRGNYKAMESRTREAVQNYERANYSAARWKERAEALERDQAQAPAGGPQRSAEGSTPSSAAPQGADGNTDLLSGVDMGLFTEIAETKGHHAAAYYLARELSKGIPQYVQSQVEAAVAPFRAQSNEVQLTNHIAGLYKRLSEATIDDPITGTSREAYPELSDPEAAAAIGQFFINLPLTDEARLTPYGMHLAVLAYRDLRSRIEMPGAQSAAADPGAMAVATAAAANLLPGAPQTADPVSGASLPPRRPNGQASYGDRVLAGMDAARVIDKTLGFTPRRR